MLKKTLLMASLLLSTLTFAQSNSTYKGVVVNKDKTPLDVFSVVIFNAQDTSKQVFSNTYTNGNFDIGFTPVKGEKYGAYLLSMGYKDMRLDLHKLTDTIVMPTKSMVLEDAVVEGKRKVTTSLGTEGGVLFDVSNTYLSDMGNSTDLLNFIPGVQADKDGKVTMVGVQGEVVIYINNVRVKEVEKLKTYKSEDINSVEVLRSPGAKYKNAAAVILIKTNKEYEGFSSLIEMQGFLTADANYEVNPNIQASYTKGKITASASYKLDRDVSENEGTSTKIIDKYISPDNWTFADENKGDNNIFDHWYNANLDYRITEKHLLTFQYTGSHDNTKSNNVTNQTITANSFGNMMDNKYALKSDASTLSNTGHMYYRGEVNPKFTIEYNADFSSRINDNDNANTWQQGDAPAEAFSQKTKSDASAFTTDVLFINQIKEKHALSYGLEYSYLQDNVTSNTKEGMATNYKQNSTFVKTILEYKLQVIKPLSLSFGFNYLYNNIKDNNTTDNGKIYNSVIPYFGIQYYNAEKEYGIGLNVKHNNYQPDAGMLDDVTINYTSPYEISTGNKNLENMKFTYVDVDFSYKQAYIGMSYSNLINCIISFPTVEMQSDNTPLITTKPINLTDPINMVGLYAGYSNNFKFWTPSFNVYMSYSNAKLANGEGVIEQKQGFFAILMMSNRFNLPKKYFISLFANYVPRGYSLYEKTGDSYAIRLNIEKRLLKDQLRISILTKFTNDWSATSSAINGIYQDNRSYSSWYKFIGISASWRFNNHKEVQRAKESAYMNML